MNYQSLIASIQAAIYNNGVELITGNVLQGVLLDMVNALDSAGATYGGTITPASAAPADLDQPTVYLALDAGTYTNYLDSGGNPIVTTGPALIAYDGGASLVFTKTDLPSGGSGATVITNDGSEGDSVAIRLTDNQFYKRSFRIDMTAEYSGGANEQRIGSLIVECYENSTERSHGYYYGNAMADILTEVAVYQDDTDPDTFYLMLTHDSSLDSVTFAITPLDGGEVDAFITNAGDDHTKIEDATITQVGSGGGDGKIGIVSQTQTWSGTGSNPRTYVMSNPVTGLIPQANIDLFVAAGATFNESTGYFELNGLTDISYEEMQAIYNVAQIAQNAASYGGNGIRNIKKCPRTFLPLSNGYTIGYSNLLRSVASDSEGTGRLEVLGIGTSSEDMMMGNGFSNFAYNCSTLRKIGVNGALSMNNAADMSNAFVNCYSLQEVKIIGLRSSVVFANAYFASPLNLASIVHMVENAANTGAITITIGSSVYALCTADTTEYTYQGNTYTGIIAYANARNITIASA